KRSLFLHRGRPTGRFHHRRRLNRDNRRGGSSNRRLWRRRLCRSCTDEEPATPRRDAVRMTRHSSTRRGTLPSTPVAGGWENYVLPPLDLLEAPPAKVGRAGAEANENIETLVNTLRQFRIEAQVVEIADGRTA